MHHPNTLEVTQSALLIIDMQEAFRTSIADFNQTAARIVLAVKGSTLLRVPLLVTEQYPKGLGHTASEIKALLPQDTEIIEKSTFSSCGSQTFQAQLEKAHVKQVLVAGLEAHICVNQTVHDLLASGFQVHLLTDCITSRKPDDKKVALGKMQLSGAIPSSLEMALLELLRDSKHEQFKAIQGLIK
jgi:nicotinamidase-related amidase